MLINSIHALWAHSHIFKHNVQGTFKVCGSKHKKNAFRKRKFEVRIHLFCNQLQFAVSNAESWCVCVTSSSPSFSRIVTGNNTNNKSESDQEDNDDVNDNDWSYGAEKKGDVLTLHLDLFVDHRN